jgi:hypothetical protein
MIKQKLFHIRYLFLGFLLVAGVVTTLVIMPPPLSAEGLARYTIDLNDMSATNGKMLHNENALKNLPASHPLSPDILNTQFEKEEQERSQNYTMFQASALVWFEKQIGVNSFAYKFEATDEVKYVYDLLITSLDQTVNAEQLTASYNGKNEIQGVAYELAPIEGNYGDGEWNYWFIGIDNNVLVMLHVIGGEQQKALSGFNSATQVLLNKDL